MTSAPSAPPAIPVDVKAPCQIAATAAGSRSAFSPMTSSASVT